MDAEKTLQVSLTLKEWQNVLATIEVGIKALGFPAFVTGGHLMENIKHQLEAAVSEQPAE